MQRYEINAPAVSGEILDGEAVIMHLGRGHYFSAEGSGALLWAGIEQRLTIADLAEALMSRYAIDRNQAEQAANGFLEELAAHDLVRECASLQEAARDLDIGPITDIYSTPRLQIYTDMEDLLLLDPIHDVDEVGWPVPAPLRA